MTEPSVIVLLTDFGNDPYTGIIKGRILQINPVATIISLTNHIEKHAIRQGAFILQKSYKYFPPKTIFLVVVDPGVGSLRKALVAQTENYFFIAPDNGILSPIISHTAAPTIIELPIPSYASSTFHGRDVFAPAAAKLSLNYPLEDLGIRTTLETKLGFFYDRGSHTGEVIFIDEFGNIITNIPKFYEISVNDQFILSTGQKKLKMDFKPTYSEGSTHEPFLVLSSFETLEITIREGRACDLVPIPPGDRVTITPFSGH